MTEQSIDIHQAKVKDLKTIVSLLRLNIGIFLETEIPEAGKNIREIISKRNKENDFLVAKVSNKTVGCAGFEKQKDTKGVYSLNWLAVHPDFQGRFIGTELYRFIEKRIKKLKGRIIFLNAGSGEENRYFYRKMGFKESGRISKYYNERKDLILYCKLL